jgi:hypothetical protein
MVGRSGGGLRLAAVKYEQPASHQPFHRLGLVFAQGALHAMPGRAMRQHMSQLMHQGGELLALGEAPPQQDVPAMRGAVHELRAFAPPHRRAQGGCKRLQGVQIMLWNARCVHVGPYGSLWPQHTLKVPSLANLVASFALQQESALLSPAMIA